HIKELVDPDANIIWGSAFNNDLEGKIRVSVVATGIEADTSAQPAPAKVFAFPTGARSVETPAPTFMQSQPAPERPAEAAQAPAAPPRPRSMTKTASRAPNATRWTSRAS